MGWYVCALMIRRSTSLLVVFCVAINGDRIVEKDVSPETISLTFVGNDYCDYYDGLKAFHCNETTAVTNPRLCDETPGTCTVVVPVGDVSIRVGAIRLDGGGSSSAQGFFLPWVHITHLAPHRAQENLLLTYQTCTHGQDMRWSHDDCGDVDLLKDI